MSLISKSLTDLRCTFNSYETYGKLIFTYYDDKGKERVTIDLKSDVADKNIELKKEDFLALSRLVTKRLNLELTIGIYQKIYYNDQNKSINIVDGDDDYPSYEDYFYSFILTDDKLTELDKILINFLNYMK